jgi:hypothetical protein
MNKWRVNEKLVSKCSGMNGIKLSIVHIKETMRLKLQKRKWKETKTLEENEVENNNND